MEEFITIKGAREHNLQNVDLKLPRDKMVVITGISGSGKSSLAFDTIYAEGQRRYMESLSSYARQFLGQMEKPDVDYIEGLSPAISIDQKTTSKNPRSTVGTVTEIYDYLRLLYARVGHPHCPECGKPIRRQSVDQIVDAVKALPEKTKIQILAPLVRGRKGEFQKLFENAKKKGFVRVLVDGEMMRLDEEIVLKKQVKHWDSIEAEGKNLKIVYTPLHGTGNIPARRVLKELGFENVYVVPEQELPDGEFPTVSYPNPEAAEAFTLALKLAREKDADLVLATDPDADRLGVYVKDAKSGEYITLTGNMSGCLLADYEIGQTKELSGLPEDGALIKTIMTSNLADAIAKYYGVKLIEVLTGFKYIGQQILGFEQSGKGTYLFGFEESYGCLIGTHARDKDAIVATMALCEAAAYYKTKNMTLWDAMIAMYERYGYYKDGVQSITLAGIEGLAKIKEILETLRNNTPTEVAGYKVLSARDYQKDTVVDMATGAVTSTGLPSSNVLYYDLSDDAWLCVRPSGTEPKVKFYYGVKGTSLADADEKSEKFGKEVLAMIQKML